MDNKLKGNILISGGIVVVILVGITLVIAHRYQTPLTHVLHEDDVKRKPEAVADNNYRAAIPDNAPADEVFGYTKPEKVVRKNNTSTNHKSVSEKYSSLSHGKYDKQSHERDIEALHQQYKRNPVSPNMSSSDLSPLRRSSTGNSTVVSTPRKSQYPVTGNSSSQSWDSANDEFDRHEGYWNENESTNYSVSVTRNITSGSFESGIIYAALSVNVNNTPNGLIVKEYVPAGWDVQESKPAYKNYNPSTGEIKWLFIGTDVVSMEITYKIVKRDALAGASFRGIFLYNNPDGEHMTLQIDGANGA